MSFKEYLKNEAIMIVEDDALLLNTLSELLTEFEVPIMTFTDPREALKELRFKTPALIFSDMNMMGLNGIEFAIEVRKILPKVPFVLITGYGTKEVAVQGLAAGINDLLDKPLDPNKFIAIANKFLTVRMEFLKREKEELDIIIGSFIEEGLNHLDGIDTLFMGLADGPLDKLVVDSLFRKIHSIKGSCGTVPFSSDLGRLSAEVEVSLDLIRKGKLKPTEELVDLYLTASKAFLDLFNHVAARNEPPKEFSKAIESLVKQLQKHSGSQSAEGSKVAAVDHFALGAIHGPEEAVDRDEQGVFVRNEMLDQFLKLSGEMTMLRNYFQILVRDAEAQSKPEVLYKKSEEMMRGFNKITDSLQRQIMVIREVRFSQVFAKIPRTVRLVSHELGKKVTLDFVGGELGVDKNIAKDLNTVLMHMVRNSIDHGIEAPQKRLALGKPMEGKIKVEVSQHSGVMKIVVSDDGSGIDPKKILNRALELNFVTPEKAKTLTKAEILDFMLLPGFSTSTQVSNISGRGVGMDVVNEIMIARKAKLEIQSDVGKGTYFTMYIPLPRNIIVESTILAVDNGLVYAVPQAEIAHITVAKGMVTNVIGGLRSFQFKGMTIQLSSYEELLAKKTILSNKEVEKKSILILQHKEVYLGLLVDTVDGQIDSVVLPFDRVIKTLPGFKGTTLLGSDGLAYIVSVQQMVAMSQAEEDQDKELVA